MTTKEYEILVIAGNMARDICRAIRPQSDEAAIKWLENAVKWARLNKNRTLEAKLNEYLRDALAGPETLSASKAKLFIPALPESSAMAMPQLPAPAA